MCETVSPFDSKEMEMDAFLVLVVLALGLSVVLQALGELIPFRAPAAVTRVIGVAVGAGLAWMLGYSAFASFGQELRAEWMHPVMTGLVLVAVGEFLRSIIDAIAHYTSRTPAQPQTG
jgi:hypothetical protein